MIRVMVRVSNLGFELLLMLVLRFKVLDLEEGFKVFGLGFSRKV